jgi:hypothetical protein
VRQNPDLARLDAQRLTTPHLILVRMGTASSAN